MRLIAAAAPILALQLGVTTPSEVPTADDIQTWFEGGEYQQVVDTAPMVPLPEMQYLSAISHEKLDQTEEARAVYQQLAERAEDDPWVPIGRSASALLTDGGPPLPEAVETALVAAQQAVAALTPDPQTGLEPLTGPAAAMAHYQMGIVHARRKDNAGAAAAFEQVTTLAPAFAYAYYYGGLANSRIDRPDRMAINFERFLQLAPNAPEAPRVLSLMRSVRGR